MDVVASILWRRLGSPGHDACRLEQHCDGWSLDGAAVFLDDNGDVARLGYRVRCDEAWQAVSARLHGFVGRRTVDLDLFRDDGRWLNHGAVIAGIDDLIDLDLGFTPATNTCAIRRLQLAGGQGTSTAAWLDPKTLTFSPLPQTYASSSSSSWSYASPRHDFKAELVVDDHGLVVDYPGLWVAER